MPFILVTYFQQLPFWLFISQTIGVIIFSFFQVNDRIYRSFFSEIPPLLPFFFPFFFDTLLSSTVRIKDFLTQLLWGWPCWLLYTPVSPISSTVPSDHLSPKANKVGESFKNTLFPSTFLVVSILSLKPDKIKIRQWMCKEPKWEVFYSFARHITKRQSKVLKVWFHMA